MYNLKGIQIDILILTMPIHIDFMGFWDSCLIVRMILTRSVNKVVFFFFISDVIQLYLKKVTCSDVIKSLKNENADILENQLLVKECIL